MAQRLHKRVGGLPAKSRRSLRAGDPDSRIDRRAINRAIEFHDSGRYEQAVRIYRKFLEKYPDNLRVLHLCGHALHQAGDLDAGLDMLSRAVEIEPGNAAAQSDLGSALADSGRYDEALDCFRHATEIDPSEAVFFTNQGNVFRDKGDADSAAASYRRAIAIDGGLAVAHYNLGNALRDQARLDDAIVSYRVAVALDPGNALAHNNLGVVLRDRGEVDEAMYCYRRAIAADGAFLPALCNLANFLKDQSRIPEALEAYRKVLDLDPRHAVARHMVCALSGEATRQAPKHYVREIFDSYAPLFDIHLTGVLEYRAPAAMRDVVDRFAPDNSGTGATAFRRALDIGCGTGLVAEAFQGRVSEFYGVDLSTNMMAEARRKALYSQLREDELTVFLSSDDDDAPYDLILAGDVFIYIGDLAPVFGGVRQRLEDGGLFCFSVERAEFGTYELRPSGRFAQSMDYLRRLAAEHGFSVRAEEEIAVRRENDAPIKGAVVVLEKIAA